MTGVHSVALAEVPPRASRLPLPLSKPKPEPGLGVARQSVHTPASPAVFLPSQPPSPAPPSPIVCARVFVTVGRGDSGTMACAGAAALAAVGAPLPALSVRPRGGSTIAAAAARLGPGEPASPRRALPPAALPPAVQAAVAAPGAARMSYQGSLSYEDQLKREMLERQWQQQVQQPPAAAAAAVAAPPAAPADAPDLDKLMGMLNDLTKFTAEVDDVADQAEELTNLSVRPIWGVVGGPPPLVLPAGFAGTKPGCCMRAGVPCLLAALAALAALASHQHLTSPPRPLTPSHPAGGGGRAASRPGAQGS